MALAYQELPKPKDISALLDAVQPIHGDFLPLNRQSFLSREIISYDAQPHDTRATTVLSGHLHRKTPGIKHELRTFVLRDSFRTEQEWQHTVHRFCWDDQATYEARRTILLGSAAVTPSIDELETMFTNDTIDVDERIAALRFWSATGMQRISRADCDMLITYAGTIAQQHHAIERAMKR